MWMVRVYWRADARYSSVAGSGGKPLSSRTILLMKPAMSLKRMCSFDGTSWGES